LRQEWKSANLNGISRFPSHQSYFRIADNPGSGGSQSGRLELPLSEMALSAPIWQSRAVARSGICGDSP
jgi:hypothetical protein